MVREVSIAIALLLSPLGVYVIFGPGSPPLEGVGTAPELADLSKPARAGRAAFGEYCAQCHGPLAEGTERGPPLVHPDYAPGVRTNGDFRKAVREGLRAWRWWYGDMPAIADVSEHELEHMIRFLREMQRANGID